MFVEHYVSCGKCEWCHLGQYRHCENTDWRYNPDAIRYGYTSAEKAPHLWGGFAQYVYLPGTPSFTMCRRALRRNWRDW